MALKHKSKSNVTLALGTTIGVVISILLWLITTAVLTSIVLNETIGIKNLNWMIPVTQGVNTFAGAYVSRVLVRDKKNLANAICGSVYLLFMICVALFFAGEFSKEFCFIVLCIVAGCVSPLLIHFDKNKSTHSRRKVKRLY